MAWLRLVGVLLRDVAKDILRHRGQHILAVITLASGLLLAGGGLLAVESLHRWVTRMEALARVTVFAAEGADLNEAEAMLKRDLMHWVEVEIITPLPLKKGKKWGRNVCAS